MGHAREEAGSLEHRWIGPEHLLLGVCRPLGNEEAAGPRALRRGSSRGRSGACTPHGPPEAEPPLTPRMQRVFELSERAALERGRNRVGAEHLLLDPSKDAEGVGALALRERGIDHSRFENLLSEG